MFVNDITYDFICERMDVIVNLCTRCKVNPAVIYITKMEGGKTTTEGLCLSCAKEMGVAPIDKMPPRVRAHIL